MTNTSHLNQRKIILKRSFKGDTLVPRRVSHKNFSKKKTVPSMSGMPQPQLLLRRPLTSCAGIFPPSFGGAKIRSWRFRNLEACTKICYSRYYFYMYIYHVYLYHLYLRVKQTCFLKKTIFNTTLRCFFCKKISPCFFCICSSLQLLRFRSYPGLPVQPTSLRQFSPPWVPKVEIVSNGAEARGLHGRKKDLRGFGSSG